MSAISLAVAASGVENARQSAIRSQQEAEARRLAAERAEAEKAERAISLAVAASPSENSTRASQPISGLSACSKIGSFFS